jgi:hypothetical protein
MEFRVPSASREQIASAFISSGGRLGVSHIKKFASNRIVNSKNSILALDGMEFQSLECLSVSAVSGGAETRLLRLLLLFVLLYIPRVPSSHTPTCSFQRDEGLESKRLFTNTSRAKTRFSSEWQEGDGGGGRGKFSSAKRV